METADLNGRLSSELEILYQTEKEMESNMERGMKFEGCERIKGRRECGQRLPVLKRLNKLHKPPALL